MRHRGNRDHRALTLIRLLPIVAIGLCLPGAAPRIVRPIPADDATFRPTVIVRKGTSQGSGTVIASVDGVTLVLTAAHVLKDTGPIGIQLHRYNMGVEQTMPRAGWPVTLTGEIVARDTEADVALVRIRGRRALPFVAVLGGPGDQPGDDAEVLSVGVDGGEHISSWTTRIKGVAWFSLVAADDNTATSKSQSRNSKTKTRATRGVGPKSPEFRPAEAPGNGRPTDPAGRPYLVTARAPEHGRSGGGLYLAGDHPRLIGVCVGRVDSTAAASIGIFSSTESVHRLLRENDLDLIVSRSEEAHLDSKRH